MLCVYSSRRLRFAATVTTLLPQSAAIGAVSTSRRGVVENRNWTIVAAALVLAAGAALGGWFVSRGLIEARTGDRFVAVKGLAERQVKADLALWPLRFVATSNVLEGAQAKIAKDGEAIVAFLAAGGIAEDGVQIQGLEVTDLLAQAYRSGPLDSRFIVAQTLMVRTEDTDAVARLSQQIGRLVAAGVVLSGDDGSRPAYLFTRLNDVKPAMIAEATAAARAAAEQFARDSASRISGIRQASQGVFQILPRDDAPGQSESRQIHKTVRVVTTVEYRLGS
jgi:hypothetical protein